MKKPLIIIKGAGDLATGTAHRLFRCGFSILMLEVEQPTVIRRTVSFAEAVYNQVTAVEGIEAVCARNFDEVEGILGVEKVAVLVDPDWRSITHFRPPAVVDAIVAKKNLGTNMQEAPITIGLGPGFIARKDVHAVIETQRGHYLGKVIYNGCAAPNSGEPGTIGGYGKNRLLRAPAEGSFHALRQIGDILEQGETVAAVAGYNVTAPITGVLRGILKDSVYVTKGFKIGDIDPRGIREYCFSISDKARAVAGGVLEAVMHLTQGEELWSKS